MWILISVLVAWLYAAKYIKLFDVEYSFVWSIRLRTYTEVIKSVDDGR